MRNRNSPASTPRSRKRAQSSSESRESSLAHTLVGTRRTSVRSTIEIGSTRSAIRAPTASRHTAGATGVFVRQNRDSPARSRIAPRDSGAETGSRPRRARTPPRYHGPSTTSRRSPPGPTQCDVPLRGVRIKERPAPIRGTQSERGVGESHAVRGLRPRSTGAVGNNVHEHVPSS